MGKRLDLHKLLCDVLGTNNVYFKPPSTVRMEYPCIRYERSKIFTKSANNRPYWHGKQYTVTLMYRDPDSLLPDLIAELPGCKHDRHYSVDQLYHDVFTIDY